MSTYIEARLKGGLLLSGAASAGLHGATLRDADGVPFLPAAALKGAIREQMQRLVSDGRVRRILGGPGVGSTGEGEEPAVEHYGGGSTRAYLGDAVIHDEELRAWFANGLGYAQKTQVSIDRRSGRAADQRLFQREILAPFAEGLKFVAPVELSLLNSEERQIFAAAVTAVFALGGARTSGLGGIELQLISPEVIANTVAAQADQLKIPKVEAVEAVEAAHLVLEAVDPLCLKVDRLLGNLYRSLGHIPSSALRGAVATAGLRQRGLAGKDQSKQPEFRSMFVDEATCLRFGDALPSTTGLPMPAPTTLMTCKVAGASHGVTDTLIHGYMHRLLTQRRIYVTPETKCAEPECGQRLIPAEGFLGGAEPERRVVTRVGLDSPSARAADGQLFSIEVLERGTRFVAPIRGLDAAGRAFLTDAFDNVLRGGHGRGQGYGRVRVVDILPAPADDLMKRLERFDQWVRQSIECLATALNKDPRSFGSDDRHLAITLCSDLVPHSGEGSAEAALLADLQLADVELVHGQVRTGQRGGWNTLGHHPKPYQPILCAGSALLLRTRRPWSELRDRLTELEARGAGKAREEGLGWVRVSDPVHQPEWRTFDES